MTRQFNSMNFAWDATMYLDEGEVSPDSSFYILSSGIAVSPDPEITEESIAIGFILPNDYRTDDNFDMSNVEIDGMFYVDQESAIECEYALADLPTAAIIISFSELNLSSGGIVKGSFSGTADCELSTEIRTTESIVSGAFRLRFQ